MIKFILGLLLLGLGLLLFRRMCSFFQGASWRDVGTFIWNIDFITFVKDCVWNSFENNSMALGRSVSTGNIKRVRELIDAGVDINSRSPILGCTPLQVAVINKNVEMVRELLKCSNIDPNMKYYIKELPSFLGHGSSLADLFKNQSPLEYVLYRLRESKWSSPEYLEILKELVRSDNIDINSILLDDNTPILNELVEKDQLDLVEEIVKKENIDVNCEDKDLASTPLHCATLPNGSIQILSILLNDPLIDIDKTNNESRTALFMAIFYYFIWLSFGFGDTYDQLLEIVKKLSLHGANPYIKDQNNEDVFDLINKIDDESKREKLKDIIHKYNPNYGFAQNTESMFDQKTGFSRE